MNDSTERRRSDDFSWPVIGVGGEDVTGDVSDEQHTGEFMCMHVSAHASFTADRGNWKSVVIYVSVSYKQVSESNLAIKVWKSGI